MTQLIYGGIGSRETPKEILDSMTLIGFQLSQSHWHLRSGYAVGADQAFGLGAAQQAEISDEDRWTMYLPWSGYNLAPRGDKRFRVPYAHPEVVKVAAECHPAWDRLSHGAKLMMIRNVCIVAGEQLGEPANMILAWTPNAKRGGGTGHAMRVAEMLGIPVYDLASAYDRLKATEYINSCEERYRTVQL